MAFHLPKAYVVCGIPFGIHNMLHTIIDDMQAVNFLRTNKWYICGRMFIAYFQTLCQEISQWISFSFISKFISNFLFISKFLFILFISYDECLRIFKVHSQLLVRLALVACRTRQIYHGIPWRQKYSVIIITI